MTQDRLMQEILEVLEVFAFPPYEAKNVENLDDPIGPDTVYRPLPGCENDWLAPRNVAPNEDSILRAQTLYYKLKGAIGD